MLSVSLRHVVQCLRSMLDCQADQSGQGTIGQPPSKRDRERVRIIGCREQMERVHVQDSTKTGPDPWLVRKVRIWLTDTS